MSQVHNLHLISEVDMLTKHPVQFKYDTTLMPVVCDIFSPVYPLWWGRNILDKKLG